MSNLATERNYLLYLLARQDYPQHILRRKLRQRDKLTDNEIDTLLHEFETAGWQSDIRYASSYIRSQLQKYRGRKWIEQAAIFQKGLDATLVNGLIDGLEVDWYALCCRCYRKKYADCVVVDVKDKQKRLNYLLYNGFNYDQAQYALTADNDNTQLWIDE